MHDYSNTKDKEITYAERQLIERWHNKEKLSNRQIARLLNKAPQTINNELHKGEVHLKIKTKYREKIIRSHSSRADRCLYSNTLSLGRQRLVGCKIS